VTSDPVPDLDGGWDEGLAPERTQLAWGRTGLAVVAVVGVLARRVWTLDGGPGIVALVLIAAGALVWLGGMRAARRLEESPDHNETTGRRPFLLMTAGTVLLASGSLVFGILVTS
jgi:uncharacterized membrane protein YidH (DUF202 family)